MRPDLDIHYVPNMRRHLTNPWLPIATAVLCTLMCALAARQITARPSAGWVVVVLIPWGVIATLGIRRTQPWPVIISLAALCRFVHVGSEPWLSDDLYRYLFEGLALQSGHNPFTQAPQTLSALDPWLAARVNHADIPSIYPPFAQTWFRVIAWLDPRPWSAQLGMAMVDVANVGWLIRIRRQRMESTWPALVYALHPLPVLESAHGAHLESLAIFFCLAVVYYVQSYRISAWVAMWAGVGVKLLPIFFLPSLFQRSTSRQTSVGNLLGLGLCAVLALPILGAGSELFTAFGTYTRSWAFNGFLHTPLSILTEEYSRPVLAVCGFGVALRASLLRSPLAVWALVGAGFVLLSPTVHPWYVLWALVPSLALGHRGWGLAATSLQGSYWVLFSTVNGGWDVPVWLWPVTWGGALLGFAYAFKLEKPTTP